MCIVCMRAAVFICLSGAVLLGVVDVRCALAAPVSAQDNWKTDFDDVCSYTQNAASFSSDELKALIVRCDALKPRLENLSDPQRQITLKRLKMCRDLYAFVLESKESNNP